MLSTLRKKLKKKRSTQPFEHVHCSQRFSVGAGILGEWLDDIRKFADLITVTEVDKNDRARQLLDPDFGAVWGDKGPRDDCAISWRKSIFSKVWADTITLDAPRYKNKRGWTTDSAEAAFAVLEIDGQRLLVGVAHLPTSVVGRMVYNAYAKEFRKEAMRIAKKYNVDSIMLVADWNKNLRVPAVRGYFRKIAPKFRVTWKLPLPARGTFNKSIIDFTLAKMMVVVKAPSLLKHDKVTDHTAYRETLALAA